MAARWLVLLAALATACGGDASKPRAVAGLPGHIVDVDGRYLYFECAGGGSPTILLEAGFTGTTRDWRDVQPQLARTTRTCSYDRAGLGGSPEIPGFHDADDEIADLERLLARADLEPPYVLVGHSYGGLLARLFAHRHARDIAGVVLVDALHPDWRDRAWASIPPTAEYEALRRTYRPLVRDVNLAAGEALARRVRSLGATGLVVVSAGRPGSPNVPPSLERTLNALWDSLQRNLALLSSDSLHVVAVNSDHVVQSRLTGQPAVVVQAVRAILDAHRRGARLGTCDAVFRGLEVRCPG